MPPRPAVRAHGQKNRLPGHLFFAKQRLPRQFLHGFAVHLPARIVHLGINAGRVSAQSAFGHVVLIEELRPIDFLKASESLKRLWCEPSYAIVGRALFPVRGFTVTAKSL